MTKTATEKPKIVLPELLISSVDLSRTLRELEALDESLHQAQLRKPGEPTRLARSSVSLEDFARLNGMALSDASHRELLIKICKTLLKSAPRIHMSLAAEPSANFTKRMAIWLRANVDPLALLEIGLQPTLAAGCMVRTNNKMFDMSLRHRFLEMRHLLVEKIGEISEEAELAKPATSAPAPAVAASPSVGPSATPTPVPKAAETITDIKPPSPSNQPEAKK